MFTGYAPITEHHRGKRSIPFTVFNILIQAVFAVRQPRIDQYAAMAQGPRPGLGAPVAQPDAFTLFEKINYFRNQRFVDPIGIGAEVRRQRFGLAGVIQNMVPDEQRLAQAQSAVMGLGRNPGIFKQTAFVNGGVGNAVH